MKDEIRITVLATGFVNTKDEPPIPIKEGMYKIPSITRDQEGLTDEELDENLSDEDLDIPSFLRRGNYQE